MNKFVLLAYYILCITIAYNFGVTMGKGESRTKILSSGQLEDIYKVKCYEALRADE